MLQIYSGDVTLLSIQPGWGNKFPLPIICLFYIPAVPPCLRCSISGLGWDVNDIAADKIMRDSDPLIRFEVKKKKKKKLQIVTYFVVLVQTDAMMAFSNRKHKNPENAAGWMFALMFRGEMRLFAHKLEVRWGRIDTNFHRRTMLSLN